MTDEQTPRGRRAADLAKRFNHHPPRNTLTINQHQDVRAGCLLLADLLDDICPDGREKALALTKLEEVMFWSNAAIARCAE